MANTTTWDHYSVEAGIRKRPPVIEGAMLGVVLVFAVTMLITAASYSFEKYSLSNPSPNSLKAPGTNQQLVLRRWTTYVAIATGVLSLGVLGLFQIRWNESYQEVRRRLDTTSEELQSRTNQSKSELAHARKTIVSTELARKDLELRLQELTEEHTRLQSDLDKRRRVEQFLSQQSRELVRSKDVLELHVLARTEEVKKLQHRNELILNSAGEGICGLALDGTIAFANPAAAQITGWPIEELVGNSEEKIFRGATTIDAESRLPAGQAGEVASSKFSVSSSPTEHLKLETCNLAEDSEPKTPAEPIKLYRNDGTNFFAEYVKTPIEENGNRVGYVMIFRDVTERRRAEQDLADKNAELARSNAELEQFAFVASHDLQEPLRKILSFGDRLKTKCDAVELAEGRDYLQRMQNAAARMQTLINDLLTFSRVISRVQPFAPVELGVVVKEVLSDLEVRIERTKARVVVGELPTVEADPIQMRQLIQNLVSNALKFHKSGSTPEVRIQAELVNSDAGPGHPAMHAKPGHETESVVADFCELTIQDNGIGFDEQYLDKIFAVFQRLHGRQDYEGTGIGLAVCRRIVDRHGGSITARSKPDSGAQFIVRLPLRQTGRSGGRS